MHGEDKWAWMRGGFAAAIVVLLAGAYWPVALDDAYISAAYAHEWASSGTLRWPGGEVLEGYSNFAWVALLATAARAQVDVMLVAKLVSSLAGAVVMLLVSLRLPRNRTGDLALAALALWVPVAYWSAMAMETMAFTLVACLGWLAATRGRWWLGVACLAVASLLRPEGHAWLALGLAAGVWRRHTTRAMSPRLWELAPAAVVLASLVGYHVWRVGHFGDLLPAAYYLKVSQGSFGSVQLATELVGMIGIGCALLVLGLPSRRELVWILAPLGICAALLASMSRGDWMGHGRLLLPGVVATVMAWGACSRGPGRMSPKLALAVILALAPIELDFMQPPSLRRITPRWTDGLETPLRAPVAQLANTAPDGATVWSADVGILGNLSRLRVMDSRGLTSRVFHDAYYHRADRPLRELLSSPERPHVIHASRFAPTWRADDLSFPDGWDPPRVEIVAGPIPAEYDRVDSIEYREGRVVAAMRFYHRAQPPAHAVRIARWRDLHARYPSHPWIEWQLALALAAGGDYEAAHRTGRSTRYEDYAPWRELRESLSLPEGSTPADWIESRGFAIPVGAWRRGSTRDASSLIVSGGLATVEWEGCDAAPVAAPPGAHAIPDCARALRVSAEHGPITAFLR